DQDCGDCAVLPQIQNPVDKGSNGFLVRVNHLLHKLIPNHEVSGAGVLIHKKDPGTHLQTFDDSGRMGGAASGILGGEGCGIFSAGQAVDEAGNVLIPDGTVILRPQLQGGIVGNHVFPYVTVNVVVYAGLQG